MSSATAAPSDRSCRFQGLDDCRSGESIYRRRFSHLARVPGLLVVIMLALGIFEHFRMGSILAAEDILLSVVGPVVVTLALLWSIVVWYGNCVCLSEAMVSLHEMVMFFGTRTRTIPWGEIADVSLSSGDTVLGKGSVVLTLNEGRLLTIDDIPEPEYLYRQIKAKLSR